MQIKTRNRQHTCSTAKFIRSITTVNNAVTRQVFWNTSVILMALELKWRTCHSHTCINQSTICHNNTAYLQTQKDDILLRLYTANQFTESHWP